VAFTELRLIRVLERIEQLKEAGKWSYRQPKKQRGLGNVSKTHWDYLLDEMVRPFESLIIPYALFFNPTSQHWMRTDFREERRWKICMAHKLAAAALEWHKAGDRQTRRDRGIVVDWSRPVHDESRDIDDVEMIIERGQGAEEEIQDDSDERPFSSALISADYGSDDSDDELELEKQEVADALEPRAALEEALGHAERSESTQPENEIRPKEEDLDDSSMLRTMQHTAATMDVHPKQDETPGPLTENVQSGELTEPDRHPGLKQTSDDPLLGSDATLESTAAGPMPASKQHPKPSIYSPLRSHIAHLDYDKLILDFDDLHIHKPRDAASDDAPHDLHLLPADVLLILPELPFAFTEPPASAVSLRTQSAGKKKSEKRDRDDPHRRSDLTTSSKMTAMGSFMHTRPTLLAALDPAVRWENDHWTSFDDAPIIPDFDVPFKVPDELTSSVFYLYAAFMTFDSLLGLFDGGKPSLLIPDEDVILPGTPRDPARRAATDALWTYQDDLLLKQLVEKYPKNWGLVADLFNSSRGAISLEQRADWECKERYRSRWLGKDQGERDFTPVAPFAQDARPPQPQITTRKRMASVSSSTVNMAPMPATTFEPRKRRRHVLIFETMRKCARKRDATQKASSGMYLPSASFPLPDPRPANTRKAPAPSVHDTHGQFSKLPRLSPAELSRMKSEKEAQDMLSRRRAEDAQRQQLLQRMGNGTPGQAHVRSTAPTTRTLTCTVPRLRRKSRSLRLKGKGKGKGKASLHNS
jgi:chromatin modification-related protein VID21